MENTTVLNLEEQTKQQLLEKIKFLQSLVEEKCSLNTNCNIRHELQVHQIELEMQNRELREAQLDLEETRDRYADLYDFAPVNYFTFNDKGLIDNINLTGATKLGELRTNIINRPFSKWLTKDSLNTFIMHLRDVLESDVKMIADLKMKNASGDILDVRIQSVRSKYMQNSNYLCRSVILDVTDSIRKTNIIIRKARQLRLITDALPVMIAYLDNKENHQFANKTYINSFKNFSEDLMGKSAFNVWGQSVYKKVHKYLKLALAGQQVNFEMELPLDEENKKYFYTTLIPDSDDMSRVYGVIVLIGDITDRLAIEVVDRKRLLNIAHFSRLSTMGEMASEIAHELNQPLAAISIYSDACRRMILSGKGENKQIIQSLTDINLQAKRAGSVMKRIREFVSKKDLDRENVDVNNLVKGALELLAIEIRSHHVNLDLQLADNMPFILVDKILIEQVVFNLVRNALEAMDEINEQERTLVIKTLVTKSNEIEVNIEDSGPGLPMEELKKIFTAFHTTKTDGMGMGLSICYSIIQAHRGRIYAIPNNNRGTIFSFTLPLTLEGDVYAT